MPSHLVGNTLFVSNNTLKQVACSTAALLKYGFDLTANTEQSAPALCGSAAHEALALHFKGQTDLALPKFAELYEDFAAEHIDPDGPLGRLAYDNVRQILERWFEDHPLDALPFRAIPEYVEIEYGVPLTPDDDPEPIVFTGRIDAIVEDRDSGDWYVLDHKTTGSLNAQWARGFRLDAQLSGYMWAAQQHTDRQVTGCYINGLEFSRLPSDAKRKCAKHGVAYAECGSLHTKFQMLTTQRTPEELTEWHKTALSLAKRLRLLLATYTGSDLAAVKRVRTQGKFHGLCTFCDFNDFCAVGRPVELASSMLTPSTHVVDYARFLATEPNA